MSRPTGAHTMFFLAVLVVPAVQGAIPEPLPVAAAPGLHAAGFAALQQSLRQNSLYLDLEGNRQPFTHYQMIAILAALEHAQRVPDDRMTWWAHARQVWNLTEQAFDRAFSFYARTVPIPAGVTCIDPETNAWALQAALALSAMPSPPAGVAARSADLTTMLQGLVQNENYLGKPACLVANGRIPLFLRPVALLTLLRVDEVARNPSVQGIVRTDVNDLLATNLRDGAFQEADFYHAYINAQMLMVLTHLVRITNDTNHRTARDQVANVLLTEMVEDSGVVAAAYDLHMQAGARVKDRTGDPLNQIWVALALDLYDDNVPGRVAAGLPSRLLEHLLQRYWVPSKGAFQSKGGLVVFDTNGLTAAFGGGPTLSGISRESSRLSLIVVSEPAHEYQVLDRLVAQSVWNIRFSLSQTNLTGPMPLLVAVNDLGPMNLPAGFEPRVFRLTGLPQPVVEPNVQLIEGHADLLRMAPTLSTTPVTFRFEGRVPVEPVRSEFARTLSLSLRNVAPVPITIANLQLDIQATNLTVLSATLDGQILPITNSADRVITEQLNVPHLRITFDNVAFAPNSESVLRIAYSESQPPSIDNAVVARDPEGDDPVGARSPFVVPQGQAAYVVATVRDNVVLRQVLLRFRHSEATIEPIVMEPVVGQAGLYSARLPNVTQTGIADVTIVAVDAWDNLHEYPIKVNFENPLLVGSKILFAFSALLFLSSVVIWLKVRRKGPA